MYAKVKDNVLITYPYGWTEFIADNPYTTYSFNTDFVELFPLTDIAKQGFSLVKVVEVSQPSFTYEQNLNEGSPVFENNQWTQVWNVIQASAEEIAQRNASQASGVRKQRDAKLAKCDWTQAVDCPLTNKADWATYRQALRDLTKETGFPWTITWPTDPNGAK